MNMNKIYSFFSYFFRRSRMEKFLESFEITAGTTILDVGGTIYNWNLIDCPAKITLLNLETAVNQALPPNINYLQGDGTNLLFPDKSFDIVFSNSVIEHLFDLEHQKLFAKEISRVGKNYFVQTPNRSFFIEPHFLTPFYGYLSKSKQKKLLKNFTVWGLLLPYWIKEYCETYFRKVK
jgi:ubiquinone/menaquinone biosynthesis C-methylase UbiE